jgi:hypothetical protein
VKALLQGGDGGPMSAAQAGGNVVGLGLREWRAEQAA